MTTTMDTTALTPSDVPAPESSLVPADPRDVPVTGPDHSFVLALTGRTGMLAGLGTVLLFLVGLCVIPALLAWSTTSPRRAVAAGAVSLVAYVATHR